jgi:hypothetical protein
MSAVWQNHAHHLNDNLLRRSPEEIQSVMATKWSLRFSTIYTNDLVYLVVIVAFFGLLRWGLNWSLARWVRAAS